MYVRVYNPAERQVVLGLSKPFSSGVIYFLVHLQKRLHKGQSRDRNVERDVPNMEMDDPCVEVLNITSRPIASRGTGNGCSQETMDVRK